MKVRIWTWGIFIFNGKWMNLNLGSSDGRTSGSFVVDPCDRNDLVKELYHEEMIVNNSADPLNVLHALLNKGQFLKEKGFLTRALQAQQEALVTAILRSCTLSTTLAPQSESTCVDCNCAIPSLDVAAVRFQAGD